MSNSRKIASLPNTLTLLDDAGGEFLAQQAATTTTSYTVTWPAAVGSSGALLGTTNAAGAMGWLTALSGLTINNSVIGNSSPAAITGTTITATSNFIGGLTGNVTGNADTATTLATPRTFSITGDGTSTFAAFNGSANVSGALTLATVNSNVGSFGSSTAIPVVTVNAKGLVTAVSTASISSSLTIAADSGSNDTVTIGTDTLTFAGTTNEVETTVSDNQIQIGLPSTISGLTQVGATTFAGELSGSIASSTSATTQAASSNNTLVATTEFVTRAVSNLVDTAPSTLDTLNELAAALGDDANFASTVTTSLSGKLELSGGTMTGTLALGDSIKATFGAEPDLEIYHDGSHSYITDLGTGSLKITASQLDILGSGETMATFVDDGAVTLYHDGASKLATTASGISVTGLVAATTLTGTLTGDVVGDLTGNVTGNVSGSAATVTGSSQTAITSLGTLTSLVSSGTIQANSFSGPLVGNVTGNVSGSAATVTGNSQTAITSVGTLSALTVSGDVTIDSGTLKVDTTNNRVGILNTSPGVTLDIGSATDAVYMPVGTTAERPSSPAAGYLRYNSSLNKFEGYTDAWGEIGGGGSNTFNHNVFTGDGSTTDFVLAAPTESENNLLVFIDGVFQEQGAYSIATSGGTTTLTMSAAPASGRKLVVYQVSSAISGSNLNIDTMTGDSSTVAMTLSIAPVNENNTQVYFDGVYQSKANYSISGTALTFSTAPPTGVAVEVMTMTQTEINVPVDNTVTAAKLTANSVTTAKILDDNVTAAKLEHSINLVGNPTTTTQTAGDNSTKIATTAYADTASANAAAAVVDSAPGTLDTLNELASALGDDPNFATTVTNNIAGKLPLAGGTLTGDINFGDNDKAIFGAGSDFEIFHDSGSGYSQIKETGPAGLLIRSNDLRLQSSTGENGLIVTENGPVTVYYDNSAKLATTSTGIDVTGAIDVSGVAQIGGSTDLLYLSGKTGAHAYVSLGANNTAADFFIGADTAIPLIFRTSAAERMRIDSSGNVGIGTTPANTLTILGSVNQLDIETSTTGVTLESIDRSDLSAQSDLSYYARHGEHKFFGASYTERMRIDSSGNVGIGSASPSELLSLYKFQSDTTIRLQGSAGSYYLKNIYANDEFAVVHNSTKRMRIDSGGGVEVTTSGVQMKAPLIQATNGNVSSYTGTTPSMHSPASATLAFSMGGAERMRIDSSGNVGIGTSPSKKLHVYNTVSADVALLESTQAFSTLAFKSSTNSSTVTVGIDGAGNAAFENKLSSGSMTFVTNLAERMRIDANGRVGIGQQTPLAPLSFASTTGQKILLWTGDDVPGSGDGRVRYGMAIAASQYQTFAESTASLTFGHMSRTDGTTFTERMRIDSNGNVGIGTDSPACGLDISNGGNGSVSEQVRITSTDADSKLAFVNTGGNGAITQSSGDMRFMTNTANTERMRINSSGNLLVGCTDVPSASVAGFAVRDLSFGWIHTSYDSTNTRSHHIFYNPNGSVGTIQTSGSSTLYNTSSDQRLKENIVDAPSASDDIDALQVRSFDWKVDGSHQKYGMVAQELQNVAPEAVSTPEDPEEMMGVDYSKLVPMLVKEIQALRTRVQELENN